MLTSPGQRFVAGMGLNVNQGPVFYGVAGLFKGLKPMGVLTLGTGEDDPWPVTRDKRSWLCRGLDGLVHHEAWHQWVEGSASALGVLAWRDFTG
jgi:hypothetical protein